VFIIGSVLAADSSRETIMSVTVDMRWLCGTVMDIDIARSRGSNPARGCCVPMPTPGSVNEYQRKLGSKRAYHAMH